VNFIKATFSKKTREILRDRDKTLSLSVFIVLHWSQKRGLNLPSFQKGYVLEKDKDDARQVKKKKRNSVHLNDTGHFCAILIEIMNEPIC
jgi:hypothetical protein